jgi:ABC-2 type transport system permease protein
MRTGYAAELLKLRTLRLPWVVGLLAVAFAAVIGIGNVAALEEGHRLGVTELARAPGQLLWFLVIVVAVMASAGEFQHRTIRTTLLAEPRKAVVLAAKAGAAATYGLIVTALGLAVATASGLVTAQVTGTHVHADPLGRWPLVLGTVVVGAVWAVVATAIGVLTRSTAVTITVVLLWRFVGEGILPVVLRRPGLSSWTPSGAADSLTGMPGHGMSIAAGGGLLLVYTAAVTLVAAAVFVGRDTA